MFQCYLDDSGTHSNSKVVVWGGVLGDKHYFDRLDRAWRDLLSHPCEGKAPISKFSSANLLAGEGEFEGYNDAERDLTRRNFRQLILDCDLSIIAYGASTRDWTQVMHMVFRQRWFTAEQAVFGRAVKEALDAGSTASVPISLYFDQGRHGEKLSLALDSVLEDYGQHTVTYEFSKVEDVPALQAADLVAHECYRHFVDRLANPKAMLNPHTQRLFDGAYDASGGWLGRRAMKKAAGKTAKKLKTLGKDSN